MVDSVPRSAHPSTSPRVPRAEKKGEKRENEERDGLIGVALRKEGTLNLAARIAFRSGYENFPPRSFLYTVIVFIFNREKDTELRQTLEQGDRPLETRAARSQGRRLRPRSRDYRSNLEKWATCFATRNAETRARLSRALIRRIRVSCTR